MLMDIVEDSKPYMQCPFHSVDTLLSSKAHKLLPDCFWPREPRWKEEDVPFILAKQVSIEKLLWDYLVDFYQGAPLQDSFGHKDITVFTSTWNPQLLSSSLLKQFYF